MANCKDQLQLCMEYSPIAGAAAFRVQNPESVQKRSQKFQWVDLFWTFCGPFYCKVHTRSNYWTFCGQSITASEWPGP